MYPQDKNTFLCIFSERLRCAMNKKQFTQNQLANYVNIRQTTISDYLAGKVVPGADVFLRLAYHLDTTADYLAGLTPNDLAQHQPLDKTTALEKENALLKERLKTLGIAIRSVLDKYEC